MTPQEIQRHAAALSSLPAESPAWQSIQVWHAHAKGAVLDRIKDASRTGKPLEHWGGALDALDDFLGDLEDLRSGAWKQWPSVAGQLQDEQEKD